MGPRMPNIVSKIEYKHEFFVVKGPEFELDPILKGVWDPKKVLSHHFGEEEVSKI